MCEKQRELLMRAKVLLGSDPDGPNTVLVIRPEFGRPCPDPPLPADDYESSIPNDGQPVHIIGTTRNLGQILMTRVEDIITAAAPQQLAKTECVLVSEVHAMLDGQAARSRPAINSNLSASSTWRSVRSYRSARSSRLVPAR